MSESQREIKQGSKKGAYLCLINGVQVCMFQISGVCEAEAYQKAPAAKVKGVCLNMEWGNCSIQRW